ncbi:MULTISPECIES: MJ0042-type zinc finger domain-containing protein [Bradyrhizobium]|uniref:MJ0042 family finger-like domain-containing protein n=2 Tax=Bradyrhizobium TaxID=374 RepID=A0ABY0PI48_9BRAD|nr:MULTISPECIES: MJ0042-type zinc finger domain-containing protein [Bradyrhizobium]SDI44996.1 MJ0042 family finger-like domain-containing protein [Bradyrhizobium ottawaense]SED51935.1 MJ0042 family finger-like domain-containing protein [Bradyrhizobium lablabi]SHL51294.1 MJ0042 family finger-like domain-containing protein [Bradyrhizobium lablabi]
MHIVCPHCTTSYAINPSTLGASGRTVRCSRCKETWLARPEDAVEMAVAAPMASRQAAENDAAAEWDAMAREESGQETGQDTGHDTPVVDSPSISADWPAEGEGAPQSGDSDWPTIARLDAEGHEDIPITSHRERLAKLFKFKLPALPRIPFMPAVGLPTACAAMGALLLALVIWRADIVRLLPQTATFYRMVGLEVNLRGLAFKDIKITNETVEGKPVLVIEGMIVGQTGKPVELPRLRFSVRDEQGAEIYAWNAVLEQPVLKPGERAYFKSRLASPPPEGRNIDVRFFNKRDLAGGHA